MQRNDDTMRPVTVRMHPFEAAAFHLMKWKRFEQLRDIAWSQSEFEAARRFDQDAAHSRNKAEDILGRRFNVHRFQTFADDAATASASAFAELEIYLLSLAGEIARREKLSYSDFVERFGGTVLASKMERP